MAVPLRVSRCCDFSALARSFSAAPLTPTALSALRVVAALLLPAAVAAAAGAAAAAADEGCAVLLVSVTLGRKPPQSSGLSEDAEEEEAAAAAFAPADTRAAARGCFACLFWGGFKYIYVRFYLRFACLLQLRLCVARSIHLRYLGRTGSITDQVSSTSLLLCLLQVMLSLFVLPFLC
jgi:hypothetical protein